MTDGDYLLVRIGDPIEIFPLFPTPFIPSCLLFRSLIRRDNVVLIQTQYIHYLLDGRTYSIAVSHTNILYPANLLVFLCPLSSLIYPVLMLFAGTPNLAVPIALPLLEVGEAEQWIVMYSDDRKEMVLSSTTGTGTVLASVGKHRVDKIRSPRLVE